VNTPRAERIYETTFIIPPTVGEAGIEAVIADVKASLASKGAEVQVEERWGRRKLAYPIAKHGEGTYVLLQVKGPGEAVQEAERRMRLSENVLRYLSVRVDNMPGAIEASEKRRARRAKQEEERAAREAARAAAGADDDQDGDDRREADASEEE